LFYDRALLAGVREQNKKDHAAEGGSDWLKGFPKPDHQR